MSATENHKINSRIEALIVLASAASLLLSGWAALLGFLFVGASWLWIRRSRGLGAWLTLPAAIVLMSLAVATLQAGKGSSVRVIEKQVELAYSSLWRQLDETAERTLGDLVPEVLSSDGVLKTFEILIDEARAETTVDTTLLLVDSRGDVVAWGGRGLLHEIEASTAQLTDRSYIASFSAVTLLSVRNLVVGKEIWKLVAGTSLRTDRFPFARLAEPPRWTLAPPDASIDPAFARISVGVGPDLVYERAQPAKQIPVTVSTWRRLAQLVWGLGLLVLAWRWETAPVTADSGAPGRQARLSGLASLGAGLALLGLAARAPLWAIVLLALAGTAALAIRSHASRRRSLPTTILAGVLAAAAVPLVGLGLGKITSLPNLSNALWSTPGDLVCRVALALCCWVLLSWVGTRGRQDVEGSAGLMVAAIAAMTASMLILDTPILAYSLLVLGGVLSALWIRARPVDGTGSSIAILGLLAALLSGAGWEIGFRHLEKRSVREILLPAMAPPSADEIQALADEMEAYLESWDLESLAPAGIDGISRQDLAFKIWSESPLARYGGISALRILPEDGERSSFSYGLPLNRDGWVDWGSPLLGSASASQWEDAVIVGDGEVSLAGESWAYAEYALSLQPGFRLPVDRQGDLAEVLLRTVPTSDQRTLANLGGVQYGLWASGGRPIVSPWPRPPRLPDALLSGGEALLTTPEGPAYGFSAEGSDGLRVLFLQQLSFLVAIERVGTHVLPTLLVGVLLMGALKLPVLAADGLRAAWFKIWRSYSKRLVLVYSVLLLIPLGSINYFVVRAFEDRLVGEQEASGLRAVELAQGVLGEYVLALKPGFGIDAALDDELLHWLSSVVHHDVNLYWRGSVYASSKAEIFTAGLLPRRIPGKIYSGLTLRGHEVSMRIHQAGRSEYLELYAPLTVPGVSLAQTRLIVSLPLLAQQQETAEQIATLRRRALLGTAAVVLLTIAIGLRLARRFTAPLTDIIEGTQRIAAGDAGMNLRPVELELSTLVDAIDDMAARIHAAREELLREKRLVDRMVESITAGVISLDENQRVLMANRVAVELIGLEIGQRLSEVVALDDRLGPLADFLASVPERRLSQQTVSLEDPSADPQEWTLVWVPLPGPGEPSALLVLEDVTEVLRGQRLQAWAEMARMIAHEIKNPLTPIRLSAEHMREVFASDPEAFTGVFESCTANILRQVDELQEIASDFSTYSRIPNFDPQTKDLIVVIREVVDGYAGGLADGVSVQLESRLPKVEASFDAKLLGRAVRNLIENALRVSPPRSTITVGIDVEENRARISVSDQGPGVRDNLLQKIFDPYFSTHDSGTGLGLPIARRIVEEHGGLISASNRRVGGLEVALTLPLKQR